MAVYYHMNKLHIEIYKKKRKLVLNSSSISLYAEHTEFQSGTLT